MITKPAAFPNTNWKYSNWSPVGAPTLPGTDIKVTPLSAVPIIPKATRYHFELRLATKKVSLSADFRDVNHDISSNTKKYPIMNVSNIPGDIVFLSRKSRKSPKARRIK